MSYLYLLQLPKHLEVLYEAGKIVITDGVARDAITKRIIAHLEQVQPLANNSLNGIASGNPYFAMMGMTIDTAKVVQETIRSGQFNKIIGMIQNLQTLSSVNLALTGMNLGVSVVGFAIVINKLNRIDGKLNIISNQIQSLINSDIKNIYREISVLSKDSITLIEQLEIIPISEYIEHQVEKQLNKLESLLDDLILRLQDKDAIAVSLPAIQGLYINYANLSKSYFTNLYLSRSNLNSSKLQKRINFIYQTQNKIIEKPILEHSYNNILMNDWRSLSETDIDNVLSLYKYGCKTIAKSVENHKEILANVPIHQFQSWKEETSSTDNACVWIIHDR